MALDYSFRLGASSISHNNDDEPNSHYFSSPFRKSPSPEAHVSSVHKRNLVRKPVNPAPSEPWYVTKGSSSGIFHHRQDPLTSPLDFYPSTRRRSLSRHRIDDERHRRLVWVYGILIGGLIVFFGMKFSTNSTWSQSPSFRVAHTGWKDSHCLRTPPGSSSDAIANVSSHSVSTVTVNPDSELEIAFDYSLSTLGARVISTRHTKPLGGYDISVMGFSLYHTELEDSQEDAPLEPLVIPGRCWRFSQFPGNLIIQLVEQVRITHFTLSHILGASVPLHRLRSAPKDFQVWGLNSGSDSFGHLFGNYTFGLVGHASTQRFAVENASREYFPIVELVILNNHGLKDYTCVYRFKVFGMPMDEADVGAY